METLHTSTSKGIENTVNEINKFRLSNKNKWYQINVNNGEVCLKCYNTWIQISTKPLFSNIADITPTQFKKELFNGLSRL